MVEELTVQDTRTRLAKLEELCVRFKAVHENAVKTGNADEAKRLKDEIQMGIRELREGVLSKLKLHKLIDENRNVVREAFERRYPDASIRKRIAEGASFERPAKDTLFYQLKFTQAPEPWSMGHYTLNPDTQDLYFSRVRPDFFDMGLDSAGQPYEGQPLWCVLDSVLDDRFDSHHFPGLEYMKWILEISKTTANRDLISEFEDHTCIVPGSLFRGEDGEWAVGCLHIDVGRISPWIIPLSDTWLPHYRILLIPKK